MRLKLIAFYILTIFIPMAFGMLPFNGQGCNDFTIDKCQYDEGGLIETIKDISEKACQFYCDKIYGGVCTFFIFDNKQVFCHLLKEPFGNYVHTCRKVAGPPTPLIATCFESDDECKGFLEGYCRYEGDLLEHLEEVVPLDQCQTACVHLPACEYFVYDFDTQDCELLSAPTRICDILRGPPKPSYEECQANTSTSIPETTFTTQQSSSKATESSTTEEVHLSTTPAPPTSYRVLIVAGYNGQSLGHLLSDVELIDPTNSNSNCVKPMSLPYGLSQMISGTFNENAFVCGGLGNDVVPHSQCYQYFQGNWISGPDRLYHSRYRAASVQLDDGRTWVLGGDGDGVSTTSEILSKNGEFQSGCILPEPMQSHCAAKINETHIFVAANGYDPQTQAYIADISKANCEFFKLPPMRYRRFGAACSIVVDHASPDNYLTTRLLVAGGDPPTYSSTEMYLISSDQWVKGPSLPRGFRFGGSVYYPNNWGFIMIGGSDGNNHRSDLMWYNQMKNAFEFLPGQLITPRADFGVELVKTTDGC